LNNQLLSIFWNEPRVVGSSSARFTKFQALIYWFLRIPFLWLPRALASSRLQKVWQVASALISQRPVRSERQEPSDSCNLQSGSLSLSRSNIMIRPRIHLLICFLILGGMLVAGLVPFRRPKNNVTWLKDANGLRFGRMGVVVSDGPFRVEHECSVELWLTSDASQGSSTLLAFSTPKNPMQLWVRAYHSALLLERWAGDTQRRHGIVGIDGVFVPRKPLFVTITSGAENTSIYLNGKLARKFPHFRLDSDCTGQLVLGSSTVSTDLLEGNFYGLAVYQNELAPARVKEHYESWVTLGRPGIAENDAPAAVYLFDEHAGTLARSAVQPGPDLSIPTQYRLVRHHFLEPFWEEFKPSPSFWSDVLVNIVGFIPLGFVFCSYLFSVRPNGYAALITIIIGFGLSLAIEVLQAYLPTRSSGTTDLITNTLGTYLGVRLYTSGAGNALFAKFNSIWRSG